jgi:hypothetical protein
MRVLALILAISGVLTADTVVLNDGGGVIHGKVARLKNGKIEVSRKNLPALELSVSEAALIAFDENVENAVATPRLGGKASSQEVMPYCQLVYRKPPPVKSGLWQGVLVEISERRVVIEIEKVRTELDRGNIAMLVILKDGGSGR